MKVRGVIKIPKLPFTTGRRTFDGRSSNEGALMKINAERKLFDLPPRTVNLLIENRTFLENRVNRTSINRFALLIKIPFTGVGYAVTSYADRWRHERGEDNRAITPIFLHEYRSFQSYMKMEKTIKTYGISTYKSPIATR